MRTHFGLPNPRPARRGLVLAPASLAAAASVISRYQIRAICTGAAEYLATLQALRKYGKSRPCETLDRARRHLDVGTRPLLSRASPRLPRYRWRAYKAEVFSNPAGRDGKVPWRSGKPQLHSYRRLSSSVLVRRQCSCKVVRPASSV